MQQNEYESGAWSQRKRLTGLVVNSRKELNLRGGRTTKGGKKNNSTPLRQGYLLTGEAEENLPGQVGEKVWMTEEPGKERP